MDYDKKNPLPLDDEKRTILLVEDDETTRTPIAMYLEDEGYHVLEAQSAEEGLTIMQNDAPEAVISDIRFRGMNGLELLRRIKEYNPEVPVILMTAYGTVEDAVYAMHLGAETYLTKPVRIEELKLLLDKAYEKIRLRSEVRMLRRELAQKQSYGRMVGSSSAMKDAFEVIQQVANSTATVLIYGESGTGKELVAEAIHNLSPRSDGPFHKLNCAVFTQTLLESELFGHERGAFTGAVAMRKGRFESAHRGTLFLDDIAVIPESTQVKLLRFLQEREFERVGGNLTIRVDVRVIAASNEPLEEVVSSGRFREDLYYRLNVIPVKLPPLRARKDDIPLLVYHFIEKHAAELGREYVKGIDQDGLGTLIDYDWPGNVRELENWVQRAMVMCHEESITLRTMPKPGGQPLTSRRMENDGPKQDQKQKEGFAKVVGVPLKDLERDAIIATLKMAGGSTGKAAKLLGISTRKIQYKLKEYKEEGYSIPFED